MSESSNAAFVVQIDLKLVEKLKADLIEKGFDISQPPYTIFSAKSKGVSCTVYTSGKLMVQGKEKATFIEFYLEPEILKSFKFNYEKESIDPTARIGIDESGKGDFFGPLCIAGVFAEGKGVHDLLSFGVKDSKKLTDSTILKIGRKIQENFAHHIVKINPKKYNELYLQFKNLNRLLAWGHATTIEQLILNTHCTNVTIDQFADEQVVLTALRRKKIDVQLLQRHRAEEDVVVAAASILARKAFIEGLDQLGKQYGLLLPKGASALTIKAGKELVMRQGKEVLENVGKLHFKTLDAILEGKE